MRLGIAAAEFEEVLMGTHALDKTTWSPSVTELTEKGNAAITSYEVNLEYDYWSYGMA